MNFLEFSKRNPGLMRGPGWRSAGDRESRVRFFSKEYGGKSCGGIVFPGFVSLVIARESRSVCSAGPAAGILF